MVGVIILLKSENDTPNEGISNKISSFLFRDGNSES
jgi:hypothetical protein